MPLSGTAPQAISNCLRSGSVTIATDKAAANKIHPLMIVFFVNAVGLYGYGYGDHQVAQPQGSGEVSLC